MKIILAMVVSLDGKTTKWGDSQVYKWTSKEDQALFSSLVKTSRALVMGRKTFIAARKVLKIPSDTLHIVYTRDPQKYTTEAISGCLEFTDENTNSLIRRLATRGISEIFIIGGEQINTKFLQAKLITEIWLTIEPVIFGTGNNLILREKMDTDLKLLSVERLNNKGTIRLKYQVDN